MGGIALLAAITGVALIWLAVIARQVRAGQNGAALTSLSIVGALFVILLFASGRPLGMNPVLAMSLALLVALPSLLGGAAGAVLGWLLLRRDVKRLQALQPR